MKRILMIENKILLCRGIYLTFFILIYWRYVLPFSKPNQDPAGNPALDVAYCDSRRLFLAFRPAQMLSRFKPAKKPALPELKIKQAGESENSPACFCELFFTSTRGFRRS